MDGIWFTEDLPNVHTPIQGDKDNRHGDPGVVGPEEERGIRSELETQASSKPSHENGNVTDSTMVLVKDLVAGNNGDKDTKGTLDEQEDEGGEAQSTMGGIKVAHPNPDLISDDGYGAADKTQEGKGHDDTMG